MMVRGATASDRLKALERIYSYELWQRLEDLERALEGLGRPAAGDAARLQQLLLGIATSAAAFDLPAVCQAAEALACALEPGASGTAPEAPLPPVATLRDGLASLRNAVAASDLPAPAPAGLTGRAGTAARPRRLVIAFEEDADLAGELVFQLGCFGFLARTVAEPEELAAALPHAAAVLLDGDVQTSQGRVAQAIAAVVKHRREVADAPPLLVLSSRDDLETRLRAVRFGADCFLPKPVDVREIVEHLDVLVGHHLEPPYRVLLVDDAYETALPLMLTLQESGIEVELALGAMEALRRLGEVDADVVLANVELAGCSGPELAAVIRQQRDHFELPLVFLSASADLHGQLEAIRRGGDDLLPLPPPREALRLTIRQYAQRRRLLRHFRAHDGLTGLLNFGGAMAALRHETRRAVDSGKPVALALLDVDALDDVNQRLGDLAGDLVLRGLADLLRQRFRQSDALARFGNRFLVLLPNTPLAAGIRILEETRILFAEVNRRREEPAIAITLSSGIARLRPGDSASDLYQAARHALERAQGLGGDRLEVADA